MVWDPSVLRKYSTTSHFRLLNQVRSELKNSPLTRNQDGELTLGLVRKLPFSRVPVEVRGADLSNRAEKVAAPTAAIQETESANQETVSFRERLRAVQMR